MLVDYPLFYMNPTKNLIIKYYPTRKEHHSIYGNQFIDSEFSDMDGIKIRLVTNLEAFVEKVQILEEGLDDRAVELMKFMNSPLEDGDIQFNYEHMVFTKVGQENYQFMFIDNQIAVASLDFSQEQYEYYLADVEDVEANTYYIDSRWAESFSRISLE